jgi:hypothetical protein
MTIPAIKKARAKQQTLCALFSFDFQFKSSEPIAVVVELSGIEPLTSCVQGRRSPS